MLALAGEVLLRAAPTVGGAQNMIRLQMHADPGHYVLDPEFGALSVPSRREVVETPDYTYTFRTDHAGFPNPEPWPSQVEVAVLGSSLLDGQGVGMDGQFTTLLERRLGGRRVLNLAIPGGGTGQQYLAYQRYAKPLHPKLVIAVLWVTWDINNSWHFEQWRRQDADPDYTHYRMTYAETHPNGRPAQLSPFERVARFARRELGRSYLLKAGYRRLTALLGGRRAIRERVTFANGDTLFLSVRDQERLAEGMERPGTADVEEIAFRPLEQLRTEVGADGNRLLVVLMPSKEELYGADAFPAILRPIQEVRAGLQARQLPVLDLYPAFRDLGRERPPFFRDDMHPNALGNQVIADALATWIADQEIFTAPSSTATVSAVAPTK